MIFISHPLFCNLAQHEVISFNASISACENVSAWMEALSLLATLLQRSMEATVILKAAIRWKEVER